MPSLGGERRSCLGWATQRYIQRSGRGPRRWGGALVDKGSRDGASISSIQEDNDEEADRDSE